MNSTDTAPIVAAQWRLRRFAKGKPQPIRDAAFTAILGLKAVARGRGSPHVMRAIAENIKVMKRGNAA